MWHYSVSCLVLYLQIVLIGSIRMDDKRFTFHHDVDGIDYIQDKTNGFCFICDKLLCSLLNDLSTENNELKQIIVKDTIPRLMNGFEKSYNDLEEENKKLKQQLDNVDDCLTRDDMVMLRAERGFE